MSAMIDRTLNYGRDHIRNTLCAAAPYRAVLDLGAGRGHDLALAREVQPDAQLYAVEGYRKSAEYLAQQGFEVHNLDIERDSFPFPKGAIDVVIANQILEHTKELFWTFHEISRVLCEGGSLIVGVPNLASLHNRLLLMLGRQPTSLQNASAHVRGFTKSASCARSLPRSLADTCYGISAEATSTRYPQHSPARWQRRYQGWRGGCF